MLVATVNVNGIRAALRRGFRDWLDGCGADVVALQEVRCRVADLPDGAFGDYCVTYDAGDLPGRNGVAILTRRVPFATFKWSREVRFQPASVPSRPNPFVQEGRLVGVELADAPVNIVCVYVPKGGLPSVVAPATGGRENYTPEQNEARYQRKLSFLWRFGAELAHWHQVAAQCGRELLVLGDFNIAHGPADLRNWRGNLASEGFLPAERAWLDAAVGPAPSVNALDGRRIVAPAMTWPASIRPLVDVVRTLHPGEDGPYSWWSWRGRSFADDIGWRIDYHLASPGLAAKASRAWVHRGDDDGIRISDHAPVLVDYDV